jgi:hypothetical protein
MPSLAEAQARGPDSVATVLQRVGPDTWLRFAVGDSAKTDHVEGHLVTFAPQALTLRKIFPPPDLVTVPLAELRTVWQKDGTHTWRGALLGGLALGLLAARLGDLACSDTGIDTTDCQVSAGTVGALAGAGIGALVGASYPRWRLVYEQP